MKKVCNNCVHFFEFKKDECINAFGQCKCMPEPKLIKFQEVGKSDFCGQFKSRIDKE